MSKDQQYHQFRGQFNSFNLSNNHQDRSFNLDQLDMNNKIQICSHNQDTFKKYLNKIQEPYHLSQEHIYHSLLKHYNSNNHNQ